MVRSRPPRPQVACELTSPFSNPPRSLPVQNSRPPWFPQNKLCASLRRHHDPGSHSPEHSPHDVVITPPQRRVDFPGFRTGLSSASTFTPCKGSADPSFAWPLGNQEYVFLKSSMLILLFFTSPSSGSRAASVSIIWPTRTPTPSMAASTQLKGEIASWNRVPQKSVNTHIPHPLHLTIIITLRRTVMISRNPAQTSKRSDRKKIIGPTTL